MPSDRVALCGDFNVAPDDRDVSFPEMWENSVLCHADGRKALENVTEWGLIDTVRMHHQAEGPFTWWDYRRLGFPRNDGLRIDHIFASRALDAVGYTIVDADHSDHAPVVAGFDFR